MEIRAAVKRVLDDWSGYQPLRDALRSRPKLHVYLSGGAVRRVLLGETRPVKDFDLFFDGEESEAFIAELEQSGCVEYGPYGAPRWMPEPAGSASADLIPIRRFTNGLTPCATIVDVLNQLDFTLNAVAVDLLTGEVFDPQGGVRDACRRAMRAVRFDRPNVPIRTELPVTHRSAFWHRLVHYAAVLELRIEPTTLEWLQTHRPSAAETRQFAKWFFVPTLDRFDDVRARRSSRSARRVPHCHVSG